MIKRSLGKTGISVSEIAFGGVEIGMPYGIGIRGAGDMLPEREAINLLHAAVDSGINFFDTARMYGKSEAIMGRAFQHRRDEIVISTKCRHFRDREGNLPAGKKLKEIIKASLTESLEELLTGFTDIFMLHQADIGILENGEIPTIFTSLKEEGLCRATGVSTYTAAETRKAIEVGAWDVVQLPFNLVDQRQGDYFKTAAEKGIGIVVRSVLLKGLLSERGKGLHPALCEVEKHIAGYEELIDGSTIDLPTLAIKFALSFSEVSTALVGIDRMAYLRKALEAANGNYLEPFKLARARQMSFPDPDFINLPYWDIVNWLR